MIEHISVTACCHCEAIITGYKTRNDRKFCSNKCKQADYRRRKKVTTSPVEALIRGSNADLIKEVARLYAADPDLSIADVTYGKGAFWKKTPSLNVTGSDLLTVPDHPYDFRSLPYEDNSFDIVVLDPPYLAWPGKHMSDDRYRNSQTTKGFNHGDIRKLYRDGMEEATRVNDILTSYNAAFNKPLQNEDQARTKLAMQTQPKFNEIFFAERVVLVEGISDLACIEAYLRLSGKKSDFQKSGAAIVVCEGKSSLALMLLIAKVFEIPYHVIFDCDSEYERLFAEDAEKYRRPHDEHIRDNDAIFELAGHPKFGSFPEDHVILPNVTAWRFNIEKALEVEFGDAVEACNQAGRDAVGNLKGAKKQPLYVAAAMSTAWGLGKTFPTLQKVVERVLA